MATLKLFLLGAPRVEHGNKSIKLPRQKSLALLIYLAMTARAHSREQLAALLWPDASDTQARQALRNALWDIRHATGDDHLTADTETVSFDPARVWSDVHELETLAREPQRETPRALKIAPLLEGFNLKGAPEFDDWVSFERDRVQQLAIKIFRARAEAYEAQGEWSQAIRSAQHVLELEPAHEETHRQLMRLYYATNDRAAALKQYETARAALERELGVAPMEETRLLYQHILEANTLPPASKQLVRPSAHATPATVLLPFVGRESERAALQHAWQIAQAGHAQFVFVEGEAGVGKTRLIEEMLGAWEAEALVLRGTAHPFEGNEPYRPFIDLVRDYLGQDPQGFTGSEPAGLAEIWLSELARLVPELRQARRNLAPALRLQAAQEQSGLVGVTQERSRLFDAVSQFVLTLAERQPLVLFFDDLQWADPSTLALLASLARPLAHARVCIVCAYRGAETNPDLEKLIQTLSRAARLTRVPLQRFDPRQVAELVQQLSQRECSAFAEWLYRESEGNPFFIRELIAYLTAQGLLTPNASADLDQLMQALPTVVLPASIQDLIRARLQRLSELARQVLDVAAIIGRDFDFATLWRASGKTEDAALAALDELLRTQIVHQTASRPNPYEFTHTKIRDVVLSDMSLARQQILHRRVGEALELTQRERGRELDGALAFHFRWAGEWAKAARYARAAGDRARAVLASQEAIAFYTSALDALSHLDDRATTARVYSGLGAAYAILGQAERAMASYTHALAIWEHLGEREHVAQVRLEMGRAFLFRAEYRQTDELVQRALRELESLSHPDPRLIAQAHTLWGTALSLEGRALTEAQTHLRQALSLYEQANDWAGVCNAQFQLASIAAQEGNLAQAIADYEQAFAAAERGKDLMWQAMASNNIAYHALLLGERIKAQEWLQRGLAIAEAYHIVPMLLFLYTTAAQLRLDERKWNEAEAFLKKGMPLVEQVNNLERRADYLANFAEVNYGRGDTQAAVEQLTTAAQLADQMGARYASARYHLRLAEMLLEQGKPVEAQTHWRKGKQIAAEGKYRALLESAERWDEKLAAGRSRGA